MADPKEKKKTEKKVKETAAPKHSSELSEADLEKVAGGCACDTTMECRKQK